jgi:outer membrane lipoprotein LolB
MRAGVRSALAAMALLLALAGCRTVPPPASVPGPGADAPWQQQYASLASLDHYALNGRVAVAASGQGFTANLRFRREPERSEMMLDGPMGIGGYRVTLERAELRVFASNGQQLDGAAARAEMEQRLGVALPIEDLHWWLLGLPAPGPAERNQAANDEILDFQQNGWRVSIQSRMPAMGYSLPQRLTAEREGARMKLLVESWQP